MSITRSWSHYWTRNPAGQVNHAAFKTLSGPTVEPVTLPELRSWGRINFTSDDAILQSLIVAARQAVEKYLRRALLTQTVQLTLDWGPAWVELPRAPLQSVSSISVRGLDGSFVTADPATYLVDTATSLVSLKPSAVWPVHITPAGWRCTYVAGYGAVAEDVPELIRLAVLNVAIGLYDQRGTLDNLISVESAALRPYRIEGQGIRFTKGLEPPELLA